MAVPRIMMQAQGGARPLSFDRSGVSQPLLNSSTTPWAGPPFELHETVPSEEAVTCAPPAGGRQLRVIVEGSYEIVLRDGSRYIRRRGVPGSMSFHSGEGPVPVRVVGSARTVVIDLPREWLRRVQHEGAPPQGIHSVAQGDMTARALAQAMCDEVSQGAPTGALFAESLSIALLSYALDRVPMTTLSVSGALSEGQCRKLKRYIEERLTEDLRLPELAALCGLKPRHFTTVFRRAFGVPPHRYVLQRRLEQGANLLATSAYDIAEIALRTGFSSQSHFTTAFRRAYGATPARYARDHRSISSVPPSYV